MSANADRLQARLYAIPSGSMYVPLSIDHISFPHLRLPMVILALSIGTASEVPCTSRPGIDSKASRSQQYGTSVYLVANTNWVFGRWCSPQV